MMPLPPDGEAAARIRHAAVPRRDRADQFSRDQSRRPRARAGDRGREPRAGPAQPRRGHAPRSHHDDRRGGVRGGPQPGAHAGQRRLPQRPDRADPVRRRHAARLPAAAGDRAAVHQQVLHPRPPAGEFARAARGRAGPYGVHGVVAQHPGGARPPHVGRLSRAGRVAGHRGGAGDRRQQGRQCARLLRRRHAARLRARGARRTQGRERRERHAAHDDARLRRSGRHRRLRVARTARRARAAARGRPARARQRARERVREPARQRARLELRRRQLPEGRDAARLRPPVLEQRLGQPAGADVRLLPAQPVSRQPPARARRADDGRAPRSTSAASRFRPTSTRRATITSCRGARPTGPRRWSAATSRSCSAHRATSPAWSIRPPPTGATTGPTSSSPMRPDDWFDRARSVPGQLVAALVAWLAGHGGAQRPAPPAPATPRILRSRPRPGATSARRPDPGQCAAAPSARRLR